MALDVKDRIKELRGALAEKVKEADAINASIEMKDGHLVITDEHRTAFAKAMGEVKAIREELSPLEFLQDSKGYLSQPANASIADAVAAGVASGMSGKLAKSVGALFVESEEFKALHGTGRVTMEKAFELNVRDIGGYAAAPDGKKDIYSDLPTGTPGGFGTVQRDPMVLAPHRTGRVRDLFNVQQTNAAVIEFFQVTGYTNPEVSGVTNAASTVPERSGNAFALKPHTSLQFVGKQTTTKTIAHWEAAHRNTLDDEPQLRGIIDSELLYGLQLREDQQILSGNESTNTNDLPGLLNTAGIQTYSGSAGPSTDNDADAIRRAITKVFLANYAATGVVVHPTDWEGMELIKDTTGQYLLAVSIALGGTPKLWTLPVVQTPAIAENTALVGAFGLGAQLYDREQATIRTADQHEDFFLRNAVVILAEERLALATKRPESFVKVTLD